MWSLTQTHKYEPVWSIVFLTHLTEQKQRYTEMFRPQFLIKCRREGSICESLSHLTWSIWITPPPRRISERQHKCLQHVCFARASSGKGFTRVRSESWRLRIHLSRTEAAADADFLKNQSTRTFQLERDFYYKSYILLIKNRSGQQHSVNIRYTYINQTLYTYILCYMYDALQWHIQ